MSDKNDPGAPSRAPTATPDHVTPDPTPEEEQREREWAAVQGVLEEFASGKPPLCGTCSRPATCVGYGERPETLSFGCDECCGHGNEDGWCVPLAGGATTATDLGGLPAIERLIRDFGSASRADGVFDYEEPHPRTAAILAALLAAVRTLAERLATAEAELLVERQHQAGVETLLASTEVERSAAVSARDEALSALRTQNDLALERLDRAQAAESALREARAEVERLTARVCDLQREVHNKDVAGRVVLDNVRALLASPPSATPTNSNEGENRG